MQLPVNVTSICCVWQKSWTETPRWLWGWSGPSSCASPSRTSLSKVRPPRASDISGWVTDVRQDSMAVTETCACARRGCFVGTRVEVTRRAAVHTQTNGAGVGGRCGVLMGCSQDGLDLANITKRWCQMLLYTCACCYKSGLCSCSHSGQTVSSSCLSAFELLIYFSERFVGGKRVMEIAVNLLEKLQTTPPPLQLMITTLLMMSVLMVVAVCSFTPPTNPQATAEKSWLVHHLVWDTAALILWQLTKSICRVNIWLARMPQ